MHCKYWLAAASLVLGISAWAADPAVKKSDNGICHDSSSPSFGNTKKFTPFNSIDECLKSGGKMPAGKEAPAPAEVVKKSDSGICHDKSSPHYEKTKNFTPFNKPRVSVSYMGRVVCSVCT